ncbi:hypothetical protein BCV69DRAFT_283661 [Microstroma glucosiphilum]|uniref:Uncharacterized protein n=1 Tax=Pseudomicrostroma glucosiphilum TaxID=1684307 RepID=A0A316U4E4_9BASI|nr:hypothetical protein BCV69DRAFT_283661 [Pseudomicrostroma glucosiphilum]PWN20127.1 hypothetical protein BCV69DRAFT_283661 [Pseudomicrostroma glucosiphilum]
MATPGCGVNPSDGAGESSSNIAAAAAAAGESSMGSQPQRRAQTRRRPRRDDFWSREYWEERFSLEPSILRDEKEPSSAVQEQVDGHSGKVNGQEEGERKGEGEAFEWLGAGEELLTRLVEGLERRSRVNDGVGKSTQEIAKGVEAVGHQDGPLVLHIGCGSSDVGCRMRGMWEERARTRKLQQRPWALERIMNLDYAPSSLVLTRQQELQRFGDVKMQHVVADLLSLPSLLAVLPLPPTSPEIPGQETQQQLIVDAIYDKSTADAISTGPDFVLLPQSLRQPGGASTSGWSFLDGWAVKAPEEEMYEELNGYRRSRPPTSRKIRDPNEIVLEPVEMLAYNLAAVTQPGGIWAALSYSATRFDFLETESRKLSMSSEAEQTGKLTSLTALWQVESKWSVEAPGDGNGKKDVHAPEVRHWCFLLRRTGVTP